MEDALVRFCRRCSCRVMALKNRVKLLRILSIPECSLISDKSVNIPDGRRVRVPDSRVAVQLPSQNGIREIVLDSVVIPSPWFHNLVALAIDGSEDSKALFLNHITSFWNRERTLTLTTLRLIRMKLTQWANHMKNTDHIIRFSGLRYLELRECEGDFPFLEWFRSQNVRLHTFIHVMKEKNPSEKSRTPQAPSVTGLYTLEMQAVIRFMSHTVDLERFGWQLPMNLERNDKLTLRVFIYRMFSSHSTMKKMALMTGNYYKFDAKGIQMIRTRCPLLYEPEKIQDPASWANLFDEGENLVGDNEWAKMDGGLVSYQLKKEESKEDWRAE